MEIVPLKHDLVRSIHKFLNVLSIACGLLALILLVALLLFTIEYNKEQNAVITSSFTTKKPTYPITVTTQSSSSLKTTEPVPLITDEDVEMSTTTTLSPDWPTMLNCSNAQCQLSCCAVTLNSCSVTCDKCSESVEAIIMYLAERLVRTQCLLTLIPAC